ncbi:MULTISPECIES: glycosyltransferase family 32 protein [unclassified Acinetobacter]|uniref:glycosyltransferase family 32 protein n=1 Tax=unclassified Acinetobacter TaxID=196816 RepID=UPI0015D35684|nr:MULTISPECIES: glycosyltransferase [unclassified Acinetobacter]
MIEKKIHIFWFGKSKKTEFIKILNTNLKKLESYGYQIFEWNEDNYDVYKNSYTSYCYENKKWAHLSDYARLDILYQYGGIYLDQDVEVLKKFDELLSYNIFMGYMFDCNLGTAVIGANKRNIHIKKIMEIYENKEISTSSPNNDLFTKYFINNVDGFKLNGKEFRIDEILILPKYYFEQPSFNRKYNFTIHHFDNSWRNKSKLKIFLQKSFRKFVGLYLYRKLMCYKALRISPFYKEWKKNQ